MIIVRSILNVDFSPLPENVLIPGSHACGVRKNIKKKDENDRIENNGPQGKVTGSAKLNKELNDIKYINNYPQNNPERFR